MLCSLVVYFYNVSTRFAIFFSDFIPNDFVIIKFPESLGKVESGKNILTNRLFYQLFRRILESNDFRVIISHCCFSTKRHEKSVHFYKIPSSLLYNSGWSVSSFIITFPFRPCFLVIFPKKIAIFFFFMG